MGRGGSFRTLSSWSLPGLDCRVAAWREAEGELEHRARAAHTLFVTLSGGSARTVATSDAGGRYAGRDAPGAVSFIPAGRTRRAAYAAADMVFMGLEVGPTFLAGHPGAAERAPALGRVEPMTNAEDPLVAELARRLAAEDPDDPAFRLFAESAALTVLIHLSRHRDDGRGAEAVAFHPGPPGGDRRWAPVVEFVEGHLDRPIGVADLARVAGLGPDWFPRAFRAAFGVAPYRYVVKRRVERAKDLLADRRLAIADVAERLGFASQTHLHRHFRAQVGLSPKAYRDRL